MAPPLPVEDKKAAPKSFPYLSLGGAIGSGAFVIALLVLEQVYASGSFASTHRTRVLSAMVCLLLASWSSIVSLITAWCPIILGGDRRPLYWVVPLILGWLAFVEGFDWRSLALH